MDNDNDNDLHKIRVLLYQYGWIGIGKPQDWLEIHLRNYESLKRDRDRLSRLEFPESMGR